MAVTADQSRPQTRAVTSDRRPLGYYLGPAVRYALLIGVGLILFAPFILAFFGTFKSNAEITSFPPRVLPSVWQPENWSNAWNIEVQGAGSNIFARWFFNSIWLAIVGMATQLFFCSLAAYAFARMDFPGKNIIFSFLIASMAIPGAITMIPGYIFFAKLGWTIGWRSYLPLIVPGIVGAFGIFLLTQFFKSIPRELEEASYMDGASRFRTYWSVVLPMSRPALVTLAILSFQGSWNNYQGPLLFLRDPRLMTLTVGLGYFQGVRRTDWTAILVGSMFNAIPILIIFFIFNKYYMQGSNTSGLAGQ